MSKDVFLLRLVTVVTDDCGCGLGSNMGPGDDVQSRQWVGTGSSGPGVRDAAVCWQGGGRSVLGREGCYYVGLFTQGGGLRWLECAVQACKTAWEPPDQLRATIRENAEVNSLKDNRTTRESTLFFWLVVFLLCLLCIFVLYVF